MPWIGLDERSSSNPYSTLVRSTSRHTGSSGERIEDLVSRSHGSSERLVAAATSRGLKVEVRAFPNGTRNSQDVATAMGCDVAQSSSRSSSSSTKNQSLLSWAVRIDWTKSDRGSRRRPRAEGERRRGSDATGLWWAEYRPSDTRKELRSFADKRCSRMMSSGRLPERPPGAHRRASGFILAADTQVVTIRQHPRLETPPITVVRPRQSAGAGGRAVACAGSSSFSLSDGPRSGCTGSLLPSSCSVAASLGPASCDSGRRSWPCRCGPVDPFGAFRDHGLNSDPWCSGGPGALCARAGPCDLGAHPDRAQLGDPDVAKG